MATRYVLTDYIERAMDQASYDKLEDDTFAGWIPACPGVLSNAATLRECERELRSALESWILVGLRNGYVMPVLGDIDLDAEAGCEPLTTV